MIKRNLSVLFAALFMVVVLAGSLFAAEYKNAELGFSVTYPDALEKQNTPVKSTVFYAIAATKMPWLTVSIIEGGSFEAAFKASIAGAVDFTNINLKAVKEVATDSGIKGQAGQVKYIIQGTYECEGVVLGVQKNGKWILVALATVPMYDTSYSPESYEKMLKTLKFN